jgi:hypothetical protein
MVNDKYMIVNSLDKEIINKRKYDFDIVHVKNIKEFSSDNVERIVKDDLKKIIKDNIL